VKLKINFTLSSRKTNIYTYLFYISIKIVKR